MEDMPYLPPDLDGFDAHGGFDEFGIGPLARYDQKARGVYPELPRPTPSPEWVPLESLRGKGPTWRPAEGQPGTEGAQFRLAYGLREPMGNSIDRQWASEAIAEEVREKLEPCRTAYSEILTKYKKLDAALNDAMKAINLLELRIDRLEVRRS